MKAIIAGAGIMLLVAAGAGPVPVYGQAGTELGQDRLAEGKRVYIKHCVGCHGAEAKGDGYKLLGPDPANLTSPSTKKKSDAILLKTIHEGKPNMPSWNVRLSAQESRDALAYIRSLSK